MASFIKRDDGRIEIRESYTSPRGPRARTLAIGPELTDALLDLAAERASAPLDRDELIERAARVGVHRVRRTQPEAVAAVVRRARSDRLWPTHLQAIRIAIRDLDDHPLPDHLEAMADWLGTDAHERGRALVDLLQLAEAIVREQTESQRVHAPLTFPLLRDCIHK